MRNPILVLLALLVPVGLSAQQPVVAGTYRAQSGNGTVTLELEEVASGVLEGSFTTRGRRSEVEAEVDSDGSFSGFVLTEDGRFYFEATMEGEVVTLHLYPRGQGGTPDPSTAEELLFERTGDLPGTTRTDEVEQLGVGETPEPLVTAPVWDYNSNQAHQWRADLSDTEMHYNSSGGMGLDAGSTDAYYDFCYNGLFSYEITRGGNTELGTGEWRIATSNGVVGLELLFDHGGTDRLIMERRGGTLHANGVPVSAQGSGQCG